MTNISEGSSNRSLPKIPRPTAQFSSLTDIALPSGPDLRPSEFVQRSMAKLESLPIEELRKEGISRDRSTYFLNIAYPSMQAMEYVTPEQILTSETVREGKRVALYVHVPFCTAECYYCHYYKEFRKDSSYVDRFLDGIDKELEAQQRRFGGLEAASIYIGGGTPSYMTADQIDRLFTSIRNKILVPGSIEISFEMHPESITLEKLVVLKSHGVNRINVGVESFDDQLLKSENRRHTAESAIEAFNRIRSVGIHNINLDLIYGLKGQSISQWEHSLDQIAVLEPASTTMYYLRLKKGTPEYNYWKIRPETFPTDYELHLMHVMNFERMEKELGYIQSPVDWFIKDKKDFHHYQDHNWRRSDDTELLGIGPSAYSYINGWQYYNINDTGKWLERLNNDSFPMWKGEFLHGDEPLRRTVMLGIKMGMDRPAFKDTYGIDVVDAFQDNWERLEKLGLVEIKPESIDLTYTGRLFADEVGQQFYSDDMKKRMATIDPVLVSTTWPQFNK